MMFRATDVVMIGLMVGAAAFTYKTKHDAENQFDQLRKVESEIRYEEDTISILKADWSLLTQPGRLQRLVENYDAELKLVTVEPQQIVTVDAVPLKPVGEPDPLEDAIAKMIEKTDKTVTGGITR
ncbi:cell division protein FtsL [Tianweitania sediminis]|nr:hypothetical protein [Tianweitania sediminis]